MKKYFVIATIILSSGFLVLAELQLDRIVRDAETVSVGSSPPPSPSPSSAPAPNPPTNKAPQKSVNDTKVYNIANPVSEDYPAVFNIILFISISLILALIAISVTIATMDPGRDSLIYRVTSAQRYKKDN